MNNNVNMNLYMTNTSDWIALREKIGNKREHVEYANKEGVRERAVAKASLVV